MSADCPRLFEAEARRDGRLTGTERASFDRHLAVCPACSREVEALEALAAPLRDGSGAVVDELHERRERTRLLAAFERSRLSPEPRAFAHRRVLWPALAAVLSIVAAVVFYRVRTLDAPPASVSIEPRGTATWSRRLDSQAERVFLQDGTLRIQREHGSALPRLLVILPDGELEDIGTTFTVSTRAGRTTHVSVEEGRVVLRLRGKAPVTLGPGGLFTSDAPSPTESARATPALEPITPSAIPTSARSPASTARAPVASQLAPAPAPSAAASVAADDSAAREFRAATAQLDAGQNGAAAAAFARFLAQYARDPRAEDAAYLRVIALQRSGDVDATRRAASEYLRRYPRGFRRAEVETLLGQ